MDKVYIVTKKNRNHNDWPSEFHCVFFSASESIAYMQEINSNELQEYRWYLHLAKEGKTKMELMGSTD